MCGHVESRPLEQTSETAPPQRSRAETMGSLAQTVDIAAVPSPARQLVGFVVVYVGNKPAGVFFPLYNGETLLGRAGGGHQTAIALNAPSVSARHAEIRCDAGRKTYSLHDLGSRNGTERNGTRLRSGESCPLEDDDRITLGLVSIVVKILPQ